MWQEYEIEDNAKYIPIEQWGKDHWSTFAYLETRAVDARGMIDNRQMRCDSRVHREFAWQLASGEWCDASDYPTCLKDGETVDRHDDWSCLEDTVAADLVMVQWRRHYYDKSFGCNRAKVALTKRGWQIAMQLRRHKASGGKYADFSPVLD